MFDRCIARVLLLLFATTFAVAQDTPRLTTDRSTGKQLLTLPKEDDAFGFVVFGDRTGGPADGIKVLAQAVDDTNLLDPDLVMTVGDLINGYNTTERWMKQAREYKDTMANLRMPWFPVAGNHDVYWRGANKPAGEHDRNYEATFGPLWYAFEHKRCWFVVLYSDEGNPETGEKTFHKEASQRISKEQLAWLTKTLQRAKPARHVFVFLHHPRWLGNKYAKYGDDWQKVHKLLAANGNVSAVFAGHIHHMRFDGVRDGIEYHTVASVGANLPLEAPQMGYLHQFHVVTVRPDGIKVAALPVGAVIDPRSLPGETVDDTIAVHRNLRGELVRFEKAGPDPAIQSDGSIDAIATLRFENVGQRSIELEVIPQNGPPYTFGPDHQHVIIAPQSSGETTFAIRHPADTATFALPELEIRCDYLAQDRRIALEHRTLTLQLPPPDGLGTLTSPHNGVLVLDGESALSVPSDRIQLPDGPLTIEGWVLGTDFRGRRGLLAKTENCEFGIFGSNGVPEFLVHLDGSYSTAIAKEPMLQTGRWHHVAGVYDGDELRLYLDGKLIARQRGRGERTRSNRPLMIGADVKGNDQPTSHHVGRIDDVRLSKVARYDGESFTPAARHQVDEHTVLLFACDRSLGPWTPDLSGNDAHATRIGNAHCTVEKRGEVR